VDFSVGAFDEYFDDFIGRNALRSTCFVNARTLFVYSLLITELNGMYLGLAGTFGAPLRDLDGFSSLLSRFT